VKWLENNLPGQILVGACGLLLLVSVILGVAWTRPASSGGDGETPGPVALSAATSTTELAPLGEYREVTDRPLFNETRRPEIETGEFDETEAAPADTTVADAPKVSLTGVVIMPGAKIASLTPEGGGEAMLFREGHPMRGDYNGWQVSEVGPRRVTLESSNGQRLELDLLVHDQVINQPPRPEPVLRREQPAEDSSGGTPEDDDDPDRLSRAEEIRQRIAERREQLRQEAAERRDGAPPGTETDRKQINNYQSAIQDMIQGRKDKKKDDDDDR